MNIFQFQKYIYIFIYLKESLHSYWHFMHDNLFNHIDILKENIYIPDGTLIKE